MFKLFNRTVNERVSPVQRGVDGPELLFELMSQEPVDEPEVTKNRKVRESSVEVKQRIVNFLVTREGQITRSALIAEAAGANETYVNFLLKQLIERKTIKRMGKRQSYRYKVNHLRVNRKGVTNVKKKTLKTPVAKVAKAVKPVKKDESIDKILAFLTHNQDKFISQNDIALGSKTAYSKVWRLVRQLEADKKIVRSTPTYEGTKYWLYESLIDGPTVTQRPKPTRLVATTAENNLHASIDSLVWEFMRECKQTDILLFLVWLQKRK